MKMVGNKNTSGALHGLIGGQQKHVTCPLHFRIILNNPALYSSKPSSGDSAHLVANSKRAQESLGWQPQYADLSTIIRHSWQSF
ncbi:MAG: hypothetical protein DRR00_25820 [Candidatus Parabeggiatoa sp. nov. 3]|nr:MAG: hypothetical protein DRR00_25820 [Gammaproteobacteria bacterium]